MLEKLQAIARRLDQVERQLSDIEAAEASAASMTPVRREAAPAAPAAAMEQPEWLDSVVKE